MLKEDIKLIEIMISTELIKNKEISRSLFKLILV